MANKHDLSREYFSRLILSDNPEVEFDVIYSEINKLIYTKSKKTISNEDKNYIIQLIIGRLETSINESKLFEHDNIEKALKNDKFLELIDYIKSKSNLK